MKINWTPVPEGMSLKSDGVTLLTLGSLALLKENSSFDEKQLRIFANAQIAHAARIFGFIDSVAAKNVIDDSPVFTLADFEEYKGDYIYKYISKESLTYYKRNYYQLGSLGYFKKMENVKAKDELEGLTFIDTELSNRSVNCAVTIGNNYYIFCGTTQSDDNLSHYHIENFGQVLVKIELEPFIKKISKRIGAKSYKVIKVNYANSKLIKTFLPLTITSESFSNLGSNEMQIYLNHLIKECTIPCLFTKPGWFKPETEIRIAFEMPYDIVSNQPKKFEHTGILKHMRFIE